MTRATRATRRPRNPTTSSPRPRRSAPGRRGAGDPRGARSGLRWALIAWLVAALVLVAAVVAAAIVYPRRHRRGVGRPVDIELPPSVSDAELVARLEAAGVIDSPRLFALYLRARRAFEPASSTRPRPGRHLLSDDLAPREVVRRLGRSPDAMHVRVTFPEGWTKFEIARRLRLKKVCDDAAFLEAAADPSLLRELSLGDSVEGWLFPATYDLAADADPRDVVRRLVEEARGRVDRIVRAHPDGVAHLKETLGWGVEEIVSLASIVQREAVVQDERPVIASVFLNRLRDPAFPSRLLQADPTAMYGCLASSPPPPACVSWLSSGGGRPSPAIEHDPANRWSTYANKGLPPTPVSNPGELSLLAVVAPASTRYFYFVARGGGRHAFSESLDDHNRAVRSAP